MAGIVEQQRLCGRPGRGLVLTFRNHQQRVRLHHRGENPRALRPGEIETLGSGEMERLEDVPGFSIRSSVPPGLTGIAQIFAPRDIPRRLKFRYDILYVRRQSFWLDTRLIALSFWITFRGAWEARGSKF